MYVQRNMEARSLNDCNRGKARSIIYSEWVFVVLVIRHTKGIFPVILSSVACSALPHFTTLYHNGTTLGQTVCPRHLTENARIWSQTSPCGLCGKQSRSGSGCSQSTAVFPCSIIPTSHQERLKLIPD